MKKSGFLFLAVVSLFSLSIGPFVADLLATSEIIFKPGPGKNNGSDNGSVNGGKDTYVCRNDPNINHGTENRYRRASPKYLQHGGLQGLHSI